MKNTFRTWTGRMVLAGAVGLGAVAARAATLTWTGTGGNNDWNINTTANWTGDATKYNDGDTVTFPDGATNTNPLDVTGTVLPGSMTFTNATTTYTFNGGTIGGSGGLTKSGAGLTTFNLQGSASPVTLNYAGDTVINGGTLRLYFYGATPGTVKAGNGTVNMNGGTFHLFYGGGAWNAPVTCSNNLVVGPSGGTLRLEPSGWTERMWLTLSGTTTLSGPLTIIGNANGVGDGQVKGPDFTQVVTLAADSMLTFSLQNNAYPISFKGGFDGGSTKSLTIGVGTETLKYIPVAGSVFNLKNLVVNGSMSVPVSGVDTNSVFSGVTGKVIINPGGSLALGRGVYNIGSQFQFGTGTQLFVDRMDPSGWDWTHRTNFSDSTLTIGSAGPVNSMFWDSYHSRVNVGSGTGTLVIGSGGTVTMTGAEKVWLEGNLRLLDGGVLNASPGVAVGAASGGPAGCNIFNLNGKTLYLGDGSAATPETLVITGRNQIESSTPNPPGTFVFAVPVAQVSDDGNVILRYESTGISANSATNYAWSDNSAGSDNNATVTQAFRGGSAGTVFAPATLGHGIAAVGPNSGTVFTASKPTTLVTTGIVGFYNSTALGQRGTLGPITIASGGTLNLQAAGTVQASTVNVSGGGVLSGIGTVGAAVAVAANGSVQPGNSIGTLTVSSVAFADNSGMAMEVNAAGQGDQLAVTGLLDLSAALDRLDLNGTLAPGGSAHYSLLSYGTRAGQFGQVYLNGVLVSTPTDFKSIGGEYMLYYTGSTLLLVPEPTALALLALAGAAGLLRRRR